ncbi:type III-B CRISPR-associated protein Cas10/Cmr2 [Clostridium oceanicum]|uniref:Type III-B CRISPR-associated protein Cas10/Cmr2 n=1 Tax=Clostridium oceanicum TaxID=1543 RepID=A0ABN1JK60_9CLOT
MCNCIIVNVASIQNYIEKSKKTIDLFNSSIIISELMKHIAIKFTENNKDNLDMIVPNSKMLNLNDNSIQAFPNTLVFKSKNKIINLNLQINRLKEEFFLINIKKYFKNIWEDAKQSILDIPEIYVVQAEGKEYKDSYINAIRLMAARKNSRIFKKENQVCFKGYNENLKEFKQTSKLRVCDLCGEAKGKIVLNNEEQKNKKLKSLCFPCYFKRKFKVVEDKRYPSLTEVALRSWIKNEREIWNGYKKQLKSFDEEILYKDILESKYLNKFKITRKQREVLDKIRQTETVQSKYYAFIKADIDNLGLWISGKYYDEENFLEYQNKVTSFIEEFIEKIVNELKEKCEFVYVGGDDILLLSDVFSTMDIVEKLYEAIDQLYENKYKEMFSKKITLSTSVVFSHHKTPLDFALNITRKKLEQVKREYDYHKNDCDILKNGISVTYLTGGAKTITYTSIYDNELIRDLNYLKKAFHEGMSRSVAIDIEKQVRPLIDRNTDYIDLKIILSYIRRILSRKDIFKENDSLNNISKSKIQDIFKRVLTRKRKRENKETIEIDNLLSLLAICKFISLNTEKEVL